MEDEHLPSFLRERQSSKDASQTPPSASEIWEKGPTLLASLHCLISRRQSGCWGHTATPVWMTINGLFPRPSQCLQTARGNFKFTPWTASTALGWSLARCWRPAGDTPADVRQPAEHVCYSKHSQNYFSLLCPTFMFLPTDDQGHKCLWEATACRELARNEGFLGYPPISVGLLSGAGWCVLRHHMTVQCPTVISDVNKSVSNYRYSSIFTIIFPVLNKHFL